MPHEETPIFVAPFYLDNDQDSEDEDEYLPPTEVYSPRRREEAYAHPLAILVEILGGTFAKAEALEPEPELDYSRLVQLPDFHWGDWSRGTSPDRDKQLDSSPENTENWGSSPASSQTTTTTTTIIIDSPCQTSMPAGSEEIEDTEEVVIAVDSSAFLAATSSTKRVRDLPIAEPISGAPVRAGTKRVLDDEDEVETTALTSPPKKRRRRNELAKLLELSAVMKRSER